MLSVPLVASATIHMIQEQDESCHGLLPSPCHIILSPLLTSSLETICPIGSVTLAVDAEDNRGTHKNVYISLKGGGEMAGSNRGNPLPI